MHIIYTLTQMPVSVVIKALKLEGTEEKQAWIHMKAELLFLTHHSRISNVHRLVRHMTSPKYEQPLQTQH